MALEVNLLVNSRHGRYNQVGTGILAKPGRVHRQLSIPRTD
jgi:hypothetical protein